MAKVLGEGIQVTFSKLPGALWAAAAGGLLGIIITLLGKVKSVKKWLPSPVAFGIAFVVPAFIPSPCGWEPLSFT